MTGFVYKWTNTINDKWYIGSHKGTTDDGYRHSSKIFAAAEKKYGQNNFAREILFEGDYVKDKIKTVESGYLQEQNAANNPMSYNLSNISGPNCYSEATNIKRSETQKGIPKPGTSTALKGRKQSLVHNQNKGKALAGNLNGKGNKGKRKTNEHIANNRAAQNKTRHCIHCNEHYKVSVYGRFHGRRCISHSSTTAPIIYKAQHV